MAQTLHLVQSSTETSMNSPVRKIANRVKVLTNTREDLEAMNIVAPVLSAAQIS